MLKLLQAVLLVIGCICSRTHARTIYNVTLNVLNITSGIELNIGDTIKVYCEPGQESYNVYNLKYEDDFNNCLSQDTIVIGSCINSPLVININKLAFEISDQVFYEEGRSYYYTAFQTVNGIYSNNQPCLNGLKFSMNVVAPVTTTTAASSNTAVSSTVVLIEPSSSIVQSFVSSSEVVMEAVESTVVTRSTSVVDDISRPQGSTRPVQSTNNGRGRSESTTHFESALTRPPVVEGVESPSDVAVYSGAAVGGFVFLIIVLVVTIIAIGFLVHWRRERGGETSFYATKGSIEENGTLRPILNSPTHSIPSEDIEQPNHNNGTTFGHPVLPARSSGYENLQGYDTENGYETMNITRGNGNTENGYETMSTTNSNGNIDERIDTSDCNNEDDSKCNTMRSVSSTEEESIKSSTSRDPLLSPMTGNELTAFSFNLGTIDEGDSSKLHQSNCDTPV